MTPRLPLNIPRLGVSNLFPRQTHPAPVTVSIIQAASLTSKQRVKRAQTRWQKQNPYQFQLQEQRKAANKKRLDDLQEKRAALMGDAVNGMPTTWIESLDSGGQNEFSTPEVDEDGIPVEEPHALPTDKHIMNYGIRRDELEKTLKLSYDLSLPILTEDRAQTDTVMEANILAEHEKDHERRAEAVRRIVTLETGNARNRLKANVRRVVETFGRHNTDETLGVVQVDHPKDDRVPTPRAGPDTGSAEVQIGILTAKIRALAQALETTGKGDKMNKRNLRLLVHRRQKMIKYMYRKEKNSKRWHHMCETLGITDACWKGEITL